jgi:hypothetical protein
MNSYSETTGIITVSDRYAVADTVDPVTGFPGPQTSPGGYIGAYDVPGPTITNVPAARTSTRQDLSTANNSIQIHVDSDFYQIFFSPRASYAASDRWTLNVAPRFGVSYMDCSVNRTEVFTQTPAGGSAVTLGSWKDRSHESGFSFSAGLTGGAKVALKHGYHAGVFGGYEWVMDEIQMRVGPNKVSLDGGGFVGGIVFGKTF